MCIHAGLYLFCRNFLESRGRISHHLQDNTCEHKTALNLLKNQFCPVLCYPHKSIRKVTVLTFIYSEVPCSPSNVERDRIRACPLQSQLTE